MTESQPETPGKHAAPDDDPNSDPPPAAGEGGEHAADETAEEGDGEPALGSVEVDNTERDFDPRKGMFTDSEGYDEAEEKFPAIGEQGA
jgi:hypothetical protein